MRDMFVAFLEMLRSRPDALGDRRLFRSLVSDLFHEKTMQVNLLVNAFDIDVVRELKNADKIDNFLQNRLEKRLTNEYGVSQENANWAILLWCVCYGKEILNKVCEIEYDGNKVEERENRTATSDVSQQQSKVAFPKRNRHDSGQPASKTVTSSFSTGRRAKLIVRGIAFYFRWISPGAFVMGSPLSEQNEALKNYEKHVKECVSRASFGDEIQHEVRISRGFWMLESPVTQEMWEAVTGSNPSYFKGSGRLPVENISWYDSQDYVEKLNHLGLHTKGLKFNLPTEAEWEYACRAGAQTPFWFGFSLNGSEANCNGNAPYGTDDKGTWIMKTTEVGRYLPNAWGLFDMSGNVWEWCKDWYGNYPNDAITDPYGAVSGSNRVARGGSWNTIAVRCRSADRGWLAPHKRCNFCGFRLVLR